MPALITDDGPLEHLIMPKLYGVTGEAFPVADRVIDITDVCPDNNGYFGQVVLKIGHFESEPVFALQKRVSRGADNGPSHDETLGIQDLAEMTRTGQYTEYLSLTAIELGHTPDNLAAIVLATCMLS